MKESKVINIISSIIGSFLFSFGINVFIANLGFYSGGFAGISQLLNTLIKMIGIVPNNVEITGILYLLINIPVMLLALKMGKDFFYKTLLCVFIQTITFSLVPIPEVPFVENLLTSSVIGGIISGYGAGLVLKSKSSGGGMDVIGLYYASKHHGQSVGQVTLIVNVILYIIIFIVSNGNVETIIYSIIYAIATNATIDRMHTQNISVTATIISKDNTMGKYIIEETKRGVTALKAIGAYTDQETNYFVTIISKYEISRLKTLVKAKDDKAFVIINSNNVILGNYEKRL